MTAPKIRPAALYARVSTSDKGQDVGLQLDDLRALAAARGWDVREYVDEGVSGAKESRPALDRLMEDARRGKLRAVVVWRFDRFARSTRHLVGALEEFRALGVDFVSARESVDTSTPAGKMMFTMIAAMAEFERDLIRERVSAGVSRARASGKHCGRPRTGPGEEAVRAAWDKARSVKGAARLLGSPVSTVRRRLVELGLAANPR